MRRVVADVGRCSGCRLCELICSFSKEDAFSSSASRIAVLKEDKFGLDLPIVCWHCDPCKALEACPQGALERGEDGRVSVKEEECVGCKKCLEACVIGAIQLHPERNTPLICDQCGGSPLCVQECPTKALTYMETGEQEPRAPKEVFHDTLRRWGVDA